MNNSSSSNKDRLFTIMKRMDKTFKPTLNEEYVNDDRFTFKQRLNNSYFTNYDSFTTEYDSEISESDIIVTWKAALSLGESGIDNFIVSVDSIDGTYTMKLFDKQSDELMQENIKDIKEIGWKFMMNDATLPVGGSLYITDLDFDMGNKTCTVNF